MHPPVRRPVLSLRPARSYRSLREPTSVAASSSSSAAVSSRSASSPSARWSRPVRRRSRRPYPKVVRDGRHRLRVAFGCRVERRVVVLEQVSNPPFDRLADVRVGSSSSRTVRSISRAASLSPSSRTRSRTASSGSAKLTVTASSSSGSSRRSLTRATNASRSVASSSIAAGAIGRPALDRDDDDRLREVVLAHSVLHAVDALALLEFDVDKDELARRGESTAADRDVVCELDDVVASALTFAGARAFGRPAVGDPGVEHLRGAGAWLSPSKRASKSTVASSSRVSVSQSAWANGSNRPWLTSVA